MDTDSDVQFDMLVQPALYLIQVKKQLQLITYRLELFLHNGFLFWNTDHEHDGKVTAKAGHRCFPKISIQTK